MSFTFLSPYFSFTPLERGALSLRRAGCVISLSGLHTPKSPLERGLMKWPGGQPLVVIPDSLLPSLLSFCHSRAGGNLFFAVRLGAPPLVEDPEF